MTTPTPIPAAAAAAPPSSKWMIFLSNLAHTLAVLAPIASVAFSVWGKNQKTIGQVQETSQLLSGIGQALP